MNIDIEVAQKLLIVSGISGAGRSSAQRVLADLGFYAVDNLPLALLEHFIKHLNENLLRYRKIALHVNLSAISDRDSFLEIVDKYQSPTLEIIHLFLDCETASIIKRYNETRRPHPGFDPARDKTLEDTITRERNRYMPIKERANLCIDTSTLNVHDLKKRLKEFADSLQAGPTPLVRVNLLSFGYKYGLPLNCDLVVDVRFIPNPYFEPRLREQTGLDQPVMDFVLKQAGAKEFLEKYQNLLSFLLPRYADEGKAYINIGIGCTGGQHRSVVIAGELLKALKSEQYLFSVEHRDLDKALTINK